MIKRSFYGMASNNFPFFFVFPTRVFDCLSIDFPENFLSTVLSSNLFNLFNLFLITRFFVQFIFQEAGRKKIITSLSGKYLFKKFQKS